MKRLLVLALLCSVSIATSSTGPGPLWQNYPVDQNIKEYFKIYFIEGKEKDFSPTIIGDIANELSTIPGINSDNSSTFHFKINQLLKQFVANLSVREKLEGGTSTNKELNKKINEMNKKLVFIIVKQKK